MYTNIYLNFELTGKLVNRFSYLQEGGKIGLSYCVCGIGWYELLYNLFEEIELVYTRNDINIGELEVRHIEEKYGGLRIYLKSSLREVHDLTKKYEELSYFICEECGNPGSLHICDGFYLTIICNKCATFNGCYKENFKIV